MSGSGVYVFRWVYLCLGRAFRSGAWVLRWASGSDVGWCVWVFLTRLGRWVSALSWVSRWDVSLFWVSQWVYGVCIPDTCVAELGRLLLGSSMSVRFVA